MTLYIFFMILEVSVNQVDSKKLSHSLYWVEKKGKGHATKGILASLCIYLMNKVS